MGSSWQQYAGCVLLGLVLGIFGSLALWPVNMRAGPAAAVAVALGKPCVHLPTVAATLPPKDQNMTTRTTRMPAAMVDRPPVECAYRVVCVRDEQAANRSLPHLYAQGVENAFGSTSGPTWQVPSCCLGSRALKL